MITASRKLILAGGTGFLGQLLMEWFERLQWDIVVLTRRPATPVRRTRFVHWDGRTCGDWVRELEGSEALVNLAGRGVNCRYHARHRRAILASRIESTRILGEAVGACALPPKVWLNSSTATIYRHSFDQPMDEIGGLVGGSVEAKDQFSVDVAQAWEQAFQEADTPRTRKLALRTAMVFGTRRGTVFRVLRRLARLGLGGHMDTGRQYVSWVHQTDFCRAVEWLLERDELNGVVNLAAPEPLTNRDMMRVIRAACHVPVGLPATRWMLELGALVLRTETELVIKSRRVVPFRLTAAGFQFLFPDLASAVEDLEQKLAAEKSRPVS